MSAKRQFIHAFQRLEVHDMQDQPGQWTWRQPLDRNVRITAASDLQPGQEVCCTSCHLTFRAQYAFPKAIENTKLPGKPGVMKAKTHRK